jgi:hypothetical protein
VEVIHLTPRVIHHLKKTVNQRMKVVLKAMNQVSKLKLKRRDQKGMFHLIKTMISYMIRKHLLTLKGNHHNPLKKYRLIHQRRRRQIQRFILNQENLKNRKLKNKHLLINC